MPQARRRSSMRKALLTLRPITRARNSLGDGYPASGHTDIQDRAQTITFDLGFNFVTGWNRKVADAMGFGCWFFPFGRLGGPQCGHECEQRAWPTVWSHRSRSLLSFCGGKDGEQPPGVGHDGHDLGSSQHIGRTINL